MENEPQPQRTRIVTRARTVLALIGLIAVGLVIASMGRNPQCECAPFVAGTASRAVTPEQLGRAGRPLLLDLGAGKCVPCRMMAPILDELKEEYAGRFDVEFIDVWENPDAAAQYGIRAIPVQIFFDADGQELYRHQGFFAKDGILKKWEDLGVDLTN